MKTECMVISRKSQPQECWMRIGGKSIKQIDTFKNLGSWITSFAKCDHDITNRIGMAKEGFQRIKPILANEYLSVKMRSHFLHCYIHPILLYGCWTNLAQNEEMLRSNRNVIAQKNARYIMDTTYDQ